MTSLIGGIVDGVANLTRGGLANKSAPVPYTGKAGGGLFDRRGGGPSVGHMDAYGQISTLFAVVSKIANSTSKVRWRLYRKQVDSRRIMAPNEGDRREIAQHMVLDRWNRPNPFFTQQQFIETVEQHIDLTGEMWWVVTRSDFQIGGARVPLEIWPVRPDRMTPISSPTDYIAGYIYTSPDGEKVPFRTDEVIQIKMPNPLDPYRGLGPVQTLMIDLEGAAAAAAWNRNFFVNDASPGGIIELPNTLSDTEWAQFNARWRESHKGVGNAHRVAMLEGGATWKDAQYSHRDMQFTGLRDYPRELIREAYGLHGHMLGLSEDINRANAEAAEVTFSRWVLGPRLDRIKDALNFHFLPMFGESASGLEFDYDDPTLEDKEQRNRDLTTKTSAAKTLIDTGVFDPAAVLEVVGLPAIALRPQPLPRDEQSQTPELEGAPA